MLRKTCQAIWLTKAASYVLLGCASTGAPLPRTAPLPRAATELKTMRPAESAIHFYPTAPEIQLRLAQRFASGDGVPQDAFRASNWAERSALAGNSAALAWLEQRANQKDPFSALALANIYSTAASPDKAASHLAAAKTGLARLVQKADHTAEYALALGELGTTRSAPLRLGCFSIECVRVVLSGAEAKDAQALFERAAHGGYAPAQIAFGLMLANTLGLSNQTARGSIESAARQQDAQAELLLGNMGVWAHDEAAAQGRYLRAAALGLPEAEGIVGKRLLDGVGAEANQAQGRDWLRRASEHGDPNAMLELSRLYAEGTRIAKDQELSVSLCRRAAERGLAAAETALGVHYREGSGVARDPIEARKWFEKAASHGDVDGEFYLALSFDTDDANANPKRALELYERAAAHGSVAAERNIGLLYQSEQLGKDYARALTWLQRAAEHGSDAARVQIGLMYDGGKGVAKDSKQALRWFEQAAENGDARALVLAGLHYQEADGVERNTERAKDYYTRAADKGNALGIVHLGILYELGIGVERDPQRALGWYRKAATSEDGALGASYLGHALRFWDGPDHDATEGCRLLLVAAKEGYPRAQFDIGLCLESGVGVPKDENAAAYWYLEAAKQNYSDAEYELALMCLDGRGVARDRTAAEKWLERAISHGNQAAVGELSNLRERGNCDRSAKTELFGTKVSCASRRELRRALKRGNASGVSEDDNRWYDSYESSALLEESQSLELWYTRDNGWLARARYEFPSWLDTEQVARVAAMVTRKYGAPRARNGLVAVGPVRYEWALPDGVRLVVRRGWPGTTTYLEYENPKRLSQMEREIAADERAEKVRQAARQSTAF
ncbi:MAG TPA: tetratricopeptide repeat protein [Polyangiaceae bacterium]|nr:tetratricopeptide repeat protein [Polyangiaceae bacterium]